jgi:Zn-dependent protease
LLHDSGFIAKLLVWAIPTIWAIVLHEVMHGFVARGFGDDTAERAGRLTLNPLRHVDPVGTLVLPALLLFLHLPVFGYAKPVPVDFRRLRNRRLGMMLVAAAGPLTNLALAAASAIGLRILMAGPEPQGLAAVGAMMLLASVLINVSLAVFNLIPILPLDGGRVLAGILPSSLARSYAQLERFGFPLLFLLLYTHFLDRVVDPVINAVTRALL